MNKTKILQILPIIATFVLIGTTYTKGILNSKKSYELTTNYKNSAVAGINNVTSSTVSVVPTITLPPKISIEPTPTSFPEFINKPKSDIKVLSKVEKSRLIYKQKFPEIFNTVGTVSAIDPDGLKLRNCPSINCKTTQIVAFGEGVKMDRNVPLIISDGFKWGFTRNGQYIPLANTEKTKRFIYQGDLIKVPRVVRSSTILGLEIRKCPSKNCELVKKLPKEVNLVMNSFADIVINENKQWAMTADGWYVSVLQNKPSKSLVYQFVPEYPDSFIHPKKK